MVVIDDQTYRDLLDWFMCSDPWPVTITKAPGDPNRGSTTDQGNHERITLFMDEQARARGYASWVEAFHGFKPVSEISLASDE